MGDLASCYSSTGGGNWELISGTIPDTLGSSSIAIDSDATLTACSNNRSDMIFNCYNSNNGNSWSAITGITTDMFKSTAIVTISRYNTTNRGEPGGR